MSCTNDNIKCIDSKIYLGCFDNCNTIPLSFNAKQTGTHELVFRYEGQINKVEFEGVTGNEIMIPNVFNDYRKTVFNIINPDGSDFEVFQNSEQYKYFEVKISPLNN